MPKRIRVQLGGLPGSCLSIGELLPWKLMLLLLKLSPPLSVKVARVVVDCVVLVVPLSWHALASPKAIGMVRVGIERRKFPVKPSIRIQLT